ncbi:TIGR01777 family oxidoreductase [Evansella cellulosilytica]|uniref:TIGR01777 family protein n=1 Tax=Evansella cellulosilytica (strain ATCC 21833 / DSM 2522 / FERM P-1141 / JCM 9156 / N-4) TaxID=649639 RepID=E6U1Z0_EVAC2|nr:TIGR01777 family oxidoreductase [Evansella cellulosilytica]ADU29234.1 domain of unknown function DUF1731 [Evansella cellulosilytica DSM 2522]
MKIAIAGGSGFIGKALTSLLVNNGHHVFVLTRHAAQHQSKENVTFIQWLTNNAKPELELEGIDAIINLAGESLNSGRWTKEKKQQLRNSRISATNEVVRIIESMQSRPNVLVNGSAIGYYGTSLTSTFTEGDIVKSNDFLSSLVHDWEDTTSPLIGELRIVYARFGIVLSKEAGALKKMLLPYKMFVGGKLGSGQQWMSWVHIEDTVRALEHCIQTPSISGPVNITSPTPVRMHEFGKTLATVINRPYWAPVPSFVLKTVLGEMSTLVLEGQRVLPRNLQETGFTFIYPSLKEALDSLFETT